MSWEMVLLGDVLKTSAGGTPLKSKKEYYEDGEIPWLMSGEVCTKDIYSSVNKITNLGIENSSARVFPANTLLVAMYGATAGQVGILRFPCATNQAVCGILPSKNYLAEFLYYYLIYYKETLLLEVSGVAQPNLSQIKIKNILIPKLSIVTQQKIVTKLDAIFAEIDVASAAVEENTRNTEALFQSYLINVFLKIDKESKAYYLSYLCETLHQGLNTAGEKVKFYDSGFPIIQTRNIYNGIIDTTEKLKFLSTEDWEKYKGKYKPEIGDVFFTNIGTIGKTAIVTIEDDYLIHWNIFKIRPKLNLITSKFIKLALDYLTKSGYFSDRQKGGTVEFVTKKMISEVLLHIPSLENQTILTNEVDKVFDMCEKLKDTYLRKSEELNMLRQSILTQAFNGELVKE